RALIDEQRWVEAMCAIDALGIAPMLRLPVEIHSRDPLSDAEIRVRLDPSEGAWWEPEEAVVLSGRACCEGPSFRGCCDLLNLFETRENAERYLAENPSVSGHPISLPEAIEAGRIVFGDVFTEEGRCQSPSPETKCSGCSPRARSSSRCFRKPNTRRSTFLARSTSP